MRVKELNQDILYLANHIFGDHQHFEGRAYFNGYGYVMIMLWLQRKNQKVDDQKEEINYVPDVIKVSLFDQIYKVIYEMIVHADRLL